MLLGPKQGRTLEIHDDPSLFQFGTNGMVSLLKDLYHSIGSPSFVASNGWLIFYDMIQLYRVPGPSGSY